MVGTRDFEYRCQWTSEPIVVDGITNDPVWSKIRPVGKFILSDGSGPASRQTEAKLCWDSTMLYVAFACIDPDIWGTLFKRDDPIYDEEVVEIFIDPDGDMKNYYEFEVSPRNTLFDAIVCNPSGSQGKGDLQVNLEWDCPRIKTAVKVEGTLDNRTDIDKGWTVEMAIPFTSLDAPRIPPMDGDIWKVNLYRIDLTPEPEFSCWSPTMRTPPDFHIPKAFGKLIFAKDF